MARHQVDVWDSRRMDLPSDYEVVLRPHAQVSERQPHGLTAEAARAQANQRFLMMMILVMPAMTGGIAIAFIYPGLAPVFMIGLPLGLVLLACVLLTR